MSSFSATKAAERQLQSQLKKVARAIGGVVSVHVDGSTIINEAAMLKALADYEKALEPWAKLTVEKILNGVSKSNSSAWMAASKKVGTELRRTTLESTVAPVFSQIIERQVGLIKSLPREAGLRAQAIAKEAMLGSKRADVAALELMETEGVTKSRATVIARTEISKANSALTQVRAGYVGSEYYIWRTAGDGDVRDSHAAMANNIYRFDTPPEVQGEGAHHPGDFPNCRCWAEPILPS